MSDEPRRKRVRWAVWIGLVPMALLIYVLSIGPTYWIVWKLRSAPTMRALDETIYKPIYWAANRSQPFQQFLSRYVAFWACMSD